MAIYNNREVQVLGPNNMANSPETINVRNTNGSHENVAVSSVYFTDEEKSALVKAHPSKFDDVKTVSKDDVEAVRSGVAPSYDPSYKAKAESEANAKKQKDILDKNTELAKKQADKASSSSTPTPVVTPVSTPQTTVVTPGNVSTPASN